MRSIVAPMLFAAVIACSGGEDSNRTERAEPRADAAPQSASPDAPATIDCARASGQAEQAVCADKKLAALDRLAAPADERLATARNECGRADDLRACLVETYALRIADRAAAGSADDTVVSGPARFRCGDMEVAATFINSDPGYVVLAGGERPAVLPRGEAASGARYEGRIDGQGWSFWNKGREAKLVRANDELSCVETPAAD